MRALIGLILGFLSAAPAPLLAQSQNGFRYVHPYEDKDGRWIGPNQRAHPDATPLNDGWSRRREADPFVRREVTRDAYGERVYYPPPATYRVPTPDDLQRRRY
jgi:hypothetical protein